MLGIETVLELDTLISILESIDRSSLKYSFVILPVVLTCPLYISVYFRILGVTPGLDPMQGVMTIYVRVSLL